MHLLIVAIGSAGDVHPFLAIARAAQARGHRVSFCTSPAFQTLVEDCGLRFLPIGTATEYAAAMADPALWHPRTSLRTLWRVIAPSLEPVYALLLEEVQRARAAEEDVVLLGSLWALSARVLQETQDVAYLSAQVSPSTLLSAVSPPTHAGFSLPRWWPLPLRRLALYLIERGVLDRLLRPALERLRRSVGLPAAQRLLGQWVHSPQGVLALFPPWFAPAQPDWPKPLLFTGFPLFELPGPAPSTTEFDSEVQAFLEAGTAPVIITAGSTLLTDNAFFTAALEAVSALGLRAIFLGGNAASLPPLPASALHRRYLALGPLLERSAALVHHAGVGTTACALAAGVPQLVTPFAHDQFDNAQRIVALGCGLQLPAHSDGGRIADALRKLMETASVRASCRQAREKMGPDSGAVACEQAVDALETCAATRPGRRKIQ